MHLSKTVSMQSVTLNLSSEALWFLTLGNIIYSNLKMVIFAGEMCLWSQNYTEKKERKRKRNAYVHECSHWMLKPVKTQGSWWLGAPDDPFRGSAATPGLGFPYSVFTPAHWGVSSLESTKSAGKVRSDCFGSGVWKPRHSGTGLWSQHLGGWVPWVQSQL